MRLARLQSVVLLLLALLAALVWLSVWQATSQILEVTFLDVGQGDSILVKAPGGAAMLIDGGPAGQYGSSDTARRIILPALLVAGVNSLQAIVLTHAHDDHIGGLPEVIQQVPANMLLAPRVEGESDSYRRLIEIAHSKGIEVIPAAAGQAIVLGGGALCEILHPGPQPVFGSASDVNNNSTVMRLTYRQFSLLLPGDLEAEGEQYLLSRRPNLESTVLKVAHHGSDSATSEAFLAAVRPRLAIISVGRTNPFGCPRPLTLARLRAHGVRILRTDLDGAITVRTDGKTWNVRTYKRR
jgi:competence protein ComEC